MLRASIAKRLFFFLSYNLYIKRKISKTDFTRLFGFSLRVPPTVFHPKFYFTSKCLGKYLNRLDFHNATVLDVGGGSGILSLISAANGAKVTSIDINPAAVRTIQENAVKNKLDGNIVSLESDLFENLNRAASTFDYVVLNPPYYPDEPKNIGDMAWKGGNNFAFIEKFTSQVGELLKPHGIVFFVLSSDIDIQEILNIFHRNHFITECVQTRRALFEKLFIYKAAKQ